MSAILRRVHRLLLIVITAVFALSLLAPIASLASSELTAGEQAVVDNPDGTGANLRSDITTIDESTITTELAQGTTVGLIDGPLVTDTGTWFQVVAPDGTEGFASASLLRPVETETTTTAIDSETTEEEAEDTTPSDLLRQEPIDVGFVVDHNNEIPVEGLACRSTPTVDGEVTFRLEVIAPLEVVSDRIIVGDESFVHVNCGDGAGYVNGAFVVLESEQALLVDEPVVEEPVVEEPVVEEPVVEEPVVEEPVVEEPVVEEPVVEEPVVEEPVVEEPVVEEPVVEEPVVDTDATTGGSADVATTNDAAAEGETTSDSVGEATEVATEEPTAEPTEEPVTSQQSAPTSEPTAEPTAQPTQEATATEEPESTAAATTAPPSDTSKMIGTATVTGTNGDGVRCRVAARDDAATLMVLAEGTKVYVLSEPTNGYLGIDCGGLQGFTDVNYMWSGGAGDEEMQKASMSVVVTGTGNGLNCRTGAGTSYPVITVLRDGTVLTTRAAASNGWVAVTCGGKSGFVASSYVEVRSGSSTAPASGSLATSAGTATVTGTNGDGLRCRSGAGTNYSVITILAPGAKITVRGAKQGDWTPVSCGANGWVHSSFLTMGTSSGSGTRTTTPPATSTGTVTVANTGGTGLNCRSGAGTSFGVITVLRLGQSVSTRSGSTSGWQAVVCGGQNGFVSSQFVTSGGTAPSTPTQPTAPPSSNTGKSATVSNTGGDGLYCRSGAGASYSVITILSQGQTVSVRGANSNGYTPVTCGGKAGWASSQYLTIGGGSTTPAPTPSPTPAPSGMRSGDHAQTTSSLNLRYSASMGSGVAAVAPASTVVLITGGASNGFYPVDWDGLKGFMSGDYLTKTSAALSERGGSADPGTTSPPTSGGGSASGNAIVDYAMGYLGYPYVWATHGPASFDCSGFTYWVVKNVLGRDIGYGTWTQVSAGTSVSKSNLQPGDLVFFQNTYTAGLSHVGIYIGNGKFIHSQNEDTGVIISDVDSSYYGPRWYGAVRL